MKYPSYRVSQIPPQYAAGSTLVDCFRGDMRQYVRVKSVCLANTYDFGDKVTYTATIEYQGSGEPSLDPGRADCGLSIDREFKGFTPLFVPQDKVAADIIAVTGLGGHAMGSWMNNNGEMWLRDYLPKDLRGSARILVYSYPSTVSNSYNHSNVMDYADRFWQDLMEIRSSPSAQDRPIIFIGHSLGGIIIKHALTYLEKGAFDRLPLRAVLFFGTPHDGLNIDALRSVVEGQPNENLVRDLDQSSQMLAMLSSRFRIIAPSFTIYSFYETRETPVVEMVHGHLVRSGRKSMMVSRNSAVLNIQNEEQRSVPKDHRELVRLSKNEGSDYRFVVQILCKELQPTKQSQQELQMQRPARWDKKAEGVETFPKQLSENVPRRAAGSVNIKHSWRATTASANKSVQGQQTAAQ